MKTINAKEFKNLLKNNNNFQIIDIREPYEYEDGALTNENIPLDKMMSSLNKIYRDRPVIIYCQTGKRDRSLPRRSIMQQPMPGSVGNSISL